MQCRNGCGTEIKFDNNVRSSSGKAIPLEMDGQKHNCPNNPYKQIKQAAQKVEQEITTSPSIFKKTDALGKVTELETELHHQITECNKRISRLEQAVQALVGEMSFKKGSEVVTED